MKKSVTLSFLVLLFAGVSAAIAQNFDQNWSTPIKLSDKINGPYDDQQPAISKDGLSLYFCSNRPLNPPDTRFGEMDIWVSQRASVDSPWEDPIHLGENINTPGRDFAPNLSIDGRYLFFHRSGDCGAFDLFVSHRKDRRDDEGWEPAQNLGCDRDGGPNSSVNDAGPSLLQDEDGATVLYFTAENRDGRTTGFDIYKTTLQSDGTFGLAQYVPELSSPTRDTRTAIRARDGLEMFISSDRLGTKGMSDLWVSTRESTSSDWSTPQNLGDPINTKEFFEGAPALSWDATTLYFYRTKPGGNADIYMSTREKITGNDK
jgi:hypothetical protein